MSDTEENMPPKQYKTPSYVRKCQQRYYEKNKDRESFKQKRLERSKQSYYSTQKKKRQQKIEIEKDIKEKYVQALETIEKLSFVLEKIKA